MFLSAHREHIGIRLSQRRLDCTQVLQFFCLDADGLPPPTVTLELAIKAATERDVQGSRGWCPVGGRS